jgi:cystathionine beta-lyase
VVEAIRKRAEHPVYGYTFRGPEFERAVRGWVARRNGWTIAPEWIGFTPGVVAGFSIAIQGLTAPGDGILIQPPVYPPFAGMIHQNGRRVVNNPLVWDGAKYTIDFADFEEKIAKAKAFLLCNPHNPTGRVFTPEELRRIGELCVKHDTCIISDEIHSDLILKPYRHTHIASLSEEIARRTITFIAPSKTFNVAGLASSVSLIPDDSLRRRFTRQVELVGASHGNIFGHAALVAAYEQGDEWLDALMEQLSRNARYVVDFLHKNIPSVEAYVPEATFLMWIDFRLWGLNQDELCRKLVDVGLGLNNGSDFGPEGVGFMRLNIATSMEVLQEAMRRLATVAL